MGNGKRGFTLRSKACEGFTLIELLAVVAIISLLIIVGVGTYLKQLEKGYDGKRKTDIAKIKIALEEYEKDHDCYPPVSIMDCNPGDGLKPYLNKIPCEPKTDAEYYYYPDTSTCPKWYWVFTNLENTGDMAITDLGCQYGCGPDINNAIYNFYGSSPNAESPFKAASAINPPYSGEARYYGCKSGVCELISGPGSCSPNYYEDPTCNRACLNHGQPNQECY